MMANRLIGALFLVLSVCCAYPQYSRADEVVDPQAKIRELEEQLQMLRAASPAVASATPEAVATTAPALKAAEKIAPGWLVWVGAVPSDPMVENSIYVGSFVSTQARVTLADHQLDKNISFFKEPATYTMQGWLKISSPGRYSLIADIEYPPVLGYNYSESYSMVCYYYLSLEGNKVLDSGLVKVPGGNRSFEKSALVGSADLEPGLYQTKQYIACKSPTYRPGEWCGYLNGLVPEAKMRLDQNCSTSSYRGSDRVAVELSIRSPTDSFPRKVTGDQIVHKLEGVPGAN